MWNIEFVSNKIYILEIYLEKSPKEETSSNENLVAIVLTTLVFHARESKLEDSARATVRQSFRIVSR